MGVIKPEETGTALAVAAPQSETFELLNPQTFQRVWSMATSLAECDLLPKNYHGKPANVLIAMEASRVMKMSLLQVVQNLQVIEGKPGWSASFIIGAINATRRFSPLQFEYEDRGDKRISYVEYVWSPQDQRKRPQERTTDPMKDRACRAIAYDAQGRRYEGPWVSIEMAVMEGWYFRNGSKWRTMGDVMLAYRSAAFFGRLYAPEITLGLLTDDEVREVVADGAPQTGAVRPAVDLAAQIRAQASKTVDATTGEIVDVKGAQTAPAEVAATDPAESTDPLQQLQAKIEAVVDGPTLIEALAAFTALSEQQRPSFEKLLPSRVEAVFNAFGSDNTSELAAVMTAVYECANKVVKTRAVQNALNAAYKRKYEDVQGGA